MWITLSAPGQSTQDKVAMLVSTGEPTMTLHRKVIPQRDHHGLLHHTTIPQRDHHGLLNRKAVPHRDRG